MSLVGYDVSSDESDDEENTKGPESSSSSAKKSSDEDVSTSDSTGLKLSRLLPKPNETSSLINLISSKGSIKISVPEILDSDSDDESSTATVQRSSKFPANPKAAKPRSGLFAKLPPPAHAIGSGKQAGRNLIPYVFTKPKKDKVEPKKPDKVISSKTKDSNESTASAGTSGLSIKEIRERSAQAAAKLISKTALKYSEDDDSDEDSSSSAVSFFSYVEKLPEEEIANEVAEIQSTYSSENVESRVAPAPELPDDFYEEEEDVQQTYYQDEPDPNISPMTTNESSDFATAEDIIRVHGKKRKNEEINFIDINADDALRGNKELLLKSISEEKMFKRQSHSKKKNQEPSGQLKRKHQLSYLVHEAKKHELKLKNQWAQNRSTKMQTQAKYGF